MNIITSHVPRTLVRRTRPGLTLTSKALPARSNDDNGDVCDIALGLFGDRSGVMVVRRPAVAAASTTGISDERRDGGLAAFDDVIVSIDLPRVTGEDGDVGRLLLLPERPMRSSNDGDVPRTGARRSREPGQGTINV